MGSGEAFIADAVNLLTKDENIADVPEELADDGGFKVHQLNNPSDFPLPIAQLEAIIDAAFDGDIRALDSNTDSVSVPGVATSEKQQEILDEFLKSNPGIERDANNETQMSPGPSDTWTGTYTDRRHFGHGLILVVSNEELASAILRWSIDGENPISGGLLSTPTNLTHIPATGTVPFHLYFAFVLDTRTAPFYRVEATTTATDPTVFEVASFWSPHPFRGSFTDALSAPSDQNRYLLTRGIQLGRTPDNVSANLRAQGVHTHGSSITLLEGDAVFRGIWFPWQKDYIKMVVDLVANVSGTLFIDFSQDEEPVNEDDSSVLVSKELPYDPSDGLVREHIVVQSKWVRARYVNGLSGQDVFVLDVAYLTDDPGSDTKVARLNMNPNDMIASVDALGSMESDESPTGFIHDKATRSPLSGKDGKNTHITDWDRATPIRALSTGTVGSTTITSASASQFPIAPIQNRRVIHFSNHSSTIPLYYGFGPGVTPLNGAILRPGQDRSFPFTEDLDFYWIAPNIGGATSVVFKSGTTSGGTATSPSNALTSNDARASLTNGQTVIIEDFSYTQTLPTIAGLRIGLEGRKGTSPASQTVTHIETVAAIPATASSIVSPSLQAGTNRLYVAYIARNALNNVTSVSGGSLTWAKSGASIDAGDSRRIDEWFAFGSPSSTFTVTVSMNTSASVNLAVSHFANAHPTTPLQTSTDNTGTGTSVTSALTAGTDLGMAVMAVSHRGPSGIAGTGYTQRAATSTGTGVNANALYVQTKPLVTTGNETGAMTSNSSNDWGTRLSTILPAPTQPIDFLIEFEVNDGGFESAGTLTYNTITDATQYLSISDNHPLTEAAINATRIRATRTSAGSATGQIDHLFLEVTEADETSSARLSYTQAGDPDYV